MPDKNTGALHFWNESQIHVVQAPRQQNIPCHQEPALGRTPKATSVQTQPFWGWGYYFFHNKEGHRTNQCLHLMKQLEYLVRQGYLG